MDAKEKILFEVWKEHDRPDVYQVLQDIALEAMERYARERVMWVLEPIVKQLEGQGVIHGNE